MLKGSDFFQALVQIVMSIGKYKWTKKKSEFNISSAVLVLIYRQGLVWVSDHLSQFPFL